MSKSGIGDRKRAPKAAHAAVLRLAIRVKANKGLLKAQSCRGKLPARGQFNITPHSAKLGHSHMRARCPNIAERALCLAPRPSCHANVYVTGHSILVTCHEFALRLCHQRSGGKDEVKAKSNSKHVGWRAIVRHSVSPRLLPMDAKEEG